MLPLMICVVTGLVVLILPSFLFGKSLLSVLRSAFEVVVVSLLLVSMAAGATLIAWMLAELLF
jgi:hypothetical protein